MFLPTTATRREIILTFDPTTGEPADADGTPTVSVHQNGASVAPTVTVTNIGTGQYTYSYALSAFANGDQINEIVSAAVDGVDGATSRTFTVDNTIASQSSATILALGGSTITYTGPVADNGDVTLYAGADYSGSQSLVWTLTDWAGVSVNGEAVTLALMRDAKYSKTGGAPDLEITTGTASQSGSTVTVTVPVTAAQTSALLTSPPLDEDHYQLQVRSNTTKQMLVDAECTVRKNALST
jgi:hypothetical protein